MVASNNIVISIVYFNLKSLLSIKIGTPSINKIKTYQNARAHRKLN